MASSPGNLQTILNKIANYGHRYRVTFSASKMIITVIGSKSDQKYWKEMSPWTMAGETIPVEETNDHLGQLISGIAEAQKNVDKNITNTRKSLFKLMGNPFSYSSLVNPSVQFKTFETYSLGVLTSGLCSLVIQPDSIPMKSLIRLERKLYRAFLGLSTQSPVPSLYFLLGALPIEGVLARNALSLFWNLWTNPETLAFKVVRHVLVHAPENSRCWGIFIRHLTRRYNLPDPLKLLDSTPPSKYSWKGTCSAAIYSFHEKELRTKASINSKMEKLNVSLGGLRSNHPALNYISSAREVMKVKAQIKLLAGDLNLNGSIGETSNRSVSCVFCPVFEDEAHVFGISGCEAYKKTKDRIIIDIKAAAGQCSPPLKICFDNDIKFVQFLADPSSFNLDHSHRVNLNNIEDSGRIFKVCRDYVFAVLSIRKTKLKEISKSQN